MTTAVYDEIGNFVGHEPNDGCEHYSVGDHRAWCLSCTEWCYPNNPCVRCERAGLEKSLDTSPQTHWWDDREVLASVLAWAIDQSEILDLDTARYFVEKPWKYTELFLAWSADPEWGGQS